MKPLLRQEPYGGLLPCLAAIVSVGVVGGAFEVLTISTTQDLWRWDVLQSACFLGGVMFVVSLTTLLAYPLTKCMARGCAGEGRAFALSLLLATLLLPFFYIPLSVRYHGRMGTSAGMGVYLGVSILAFACLNIGRTIAFHYTTELPSPAWRDLFLSTASQLFTMGRGIGPVAAGMLATYTSTDAGATGHSHYSSSTVSLLVATCAVATAIVGAAYMRGQLVYGQHEVGPAVAEELYHDKDELPSWLRKQSTLDDGASKSSSIPASSSVMVVVVDHAPDGVQMQAGAWQQNPVIYCA